MIPTFSMPCDTCLCMLSFVLTSSPQVRRMQVLGKEFKMFETQSRGCYASSELWHKVLWNCFQIFSIWNNALPCPASLGSTEPQQAPLILRGALGWICIASLPSGFLWFCQAWGKADVSLDWGQVWRYLRSGWNRLDHGFVKFCNGIIPGFRFWWLLFVLSDFFAFDFIQVVSGEHTKALPFEPRDGNNMWGKWSECVGTCWRQPIKSARVERLQLLERLGTIKRSRKIIEGHSKSSKQKTFLFWIELWSAMRMLGTGRAAPELSDKSCPLRFSTLTLKLLKLSRKPIFIVIVWPWFWDGHTCERSLTSLDNCFPLMNIKCGFVVTPS